MSESFKILNLSAINAAGSSHRALYSALTTQMFFGQKSPLEIRLSKGIVKPYFTVPLPPIDSLNIATKKSLLVMECLQKTAEQLTLLSASLPINAIEKLIIATSLSTTHELDIDDTHQNETITEWEQLVQEYVSDFLPQFINKVTFSYVQQGVLDSAISKQCLTQEFEQLQLLITIDSLVDYSNVKNLNEVLDIQCLDGSAGIMPSEGACSTLLIPPHYPAIEHNNVITVQALNNQQDKSIKAQLTQAQFSLPSTVLHVGTISAQWATHWYGQTHSFYHQKNEDDTVISNTSLDQTLTVIDQSQILGYLGSANLSTALASASTLLTSPLAQSSSIWLVEHQINSKSKQQNSANVYKITRAADNAPA